MIWALLFTVLFALFSGSSPYLIPKMDKYIKKSVVDKEREKQALILLKESKSGRKVNMKAEKKLAKELESLFKDREAESSQFDTLFKRVMDSRQAYQVINREVAAEVQTHITGEEWDHIKLLIQKDIVKTEKKLDKISLKTEKQFEKLKMDVEKIVEDQQQRDHVLGAVEYFTASFRDTFRGMVTKMLDQEAIHYQYRASGDDLEELQEEINSGIRTLLEAQAKLHFELAEATTEQEWNQLHKKISLPY